MKSPLAEQDGFDGLPGRSVISSLMPSPASVEGTGKVEENPRAYLRPSPQNGAGKLLNWILRLAVGGAFVFAGGLKVSDPANFAIAVSHYRLVPHDWINLVAILVPWMEIVAGAFVLSGIWLRAAALVITGMTVMFAFVIVSALARGLNIECGCFGTVGGKHIGLANLAIDTTLFCLAALLVWRERNTRSPAKIEEGRRAGSGKLG
ncbi:MAG: Methylamine utilization protein MauE [Pedosphaera sp.]|nr:Methylamine utilization protein MauE [Pedosphaera sp.]